MTKLESLKQQIKNKIEQTFSLDKDLPRVMDQISELCFMGEIDHEILYIQQMPQVFLLPEFDLYNPTNTQLNEFYLTGNIRDIVFKPLWSVHWFVNLEKDYVRCFVGKEMDLTKSPKDNYSKVYNKMVSKDAGTEKVSTGPLVHELEFEIKDAGEYEQVWRDLIDVIKWSKTNTIEYDNFDKKIQQNLSQHWGRHERDNFVDEEYLQTLRTEVIKLPIKHGKININKDIAVKRMINGVSFKVVDWDDPNNTITRTFDSYKECSDYYYSLVEFVDKYGPTRKDGSKQLTKICVKRYFSNKWPIIEPTGDPIADEAAAKAQTEKLTKFLVHVTKCNETVYFKMEVWDRGIVFEIVNEGDVGNR
jgi:hypothetical protein